MSAHVLNPSWFLQITFGCKAKVTEGGLRGLGGQKWGQWEWKHGTCKISKKCFWAAL